MEKQLLLNFLQSQKLLVISTIGDEGKPWIANVYFSCTENFELVFFSSPKTKHSQNIKLNPNVAFSTVWFDQNNLGNRKGVQGAGECTLIEDLEVTEKYLGNHYKFFPSWKDSINIEKMKTNHIESRLYLVKPNYMKFWNDEEFGNEGTKEYKF